AGMRAPREAEGGQGCRGGDGGVRERVTPRGGVAGEPRAEEHESEGVVRRRAGGADEAAVLAADLASLEHGRPTAVDEVDPAFDVAVLEVLAALVDHQRVLPAEHPAVLEDRPVAVDAQRQPLAMVAGGGLERDLPGV